MIDENAIRARYAAIKNRLDERGRRLFVASEKAVAGYGGTAAVSRATGVARSTIIRGAKDLVDASPTTARIRRKGAGRPLSSKADPTVLKHLHELVEPATMGDPMRPLLWVSVNPHARYTRVTCGSIMWWPTLPKCAATPSRPRPTRSVAAPRTAARPRSRRAWHAMQQPVAITYTGTQSAQVTTAPECGGGLSLTINWRVMGQDPFTAQLDARAADRRWITPLAPLVDRHRPASA